MIATVRSAALLFGLALLASCSTGPPPARATATGGELAARVESLRAKLDETTRERENDARRIAALEDAAKAPPEDGSARARIAVLESRVAALEDEVTVLRAKLELAGEKPAEKKGERKEGRVTYLDPAGSDEKPRALPAAPEAGEVVKPFAALDGETFSFARGRVLDLARLVGIEAPTKPGAGDPDEEPKLERQKTLWGEAVASGAAWQRARERLEQLLTEGELSFSYEADGRREASGRGRLLVWAHVKKGGATTCVNDALVREGLAIVHGESSRASELRKLEDDAKREKRGLWATR